MPAPFFRIPHGLSYESTILAVQNTSYVAPAPFIAFHLTSRMSHAALSLDVGHTFYSMPSVNRFDMYSPRRHLPQDRLTFQQVEEEVQQRYIALQVIRRKQIWNPKLTEAFATIYVMLLEDDGRNYEQVLSAGLPSFISIFMRERLLEGISDNHGWPLENELNTLAVALFWLITSRDKLDQETNESRKEIMSYLAPFAFAAFRYPCFSFPEDAFQASDGASMFGHLNYNYPTYGPAYITVDYFGQSTTLRLPPIAPFAILSYFARIEYFELKVPPKVPLNRQDAVAKGILCGPTRDDIDYFNARCMTQVAGRRYGDPFDELLKSQRHDPDRRRSLFNIDSAWSHSPLLYYMPGTFSGRWQGAHIAPYLEDYRSMLHSSEAPSPFPSFGRFPLYVKFRELYCYSPSMPLPVAEDEISLFNAFLPLGCRWREDESGIEFIGANNSFRSHYTPLRRSDANDSDVSSAGALDLIITGITEAPHATAWNGYKYIGKIRPSDGLVVLLREPLDPQRSYLGRALFRGYVISSRNFVGRWRHISSAEQPAEWESIFSICKENVLQWSSISQSRAPYHSPSKSGKRLWKRLRHTLKRIPYTIKLVGMTSLGCVPQEVLENIAFFAATQGLIGPPSDLPPLLLTCRYICQALCLEDNPYLYARIFNYKFDTRSVFRRLGTRASAPRVLAYELKKRWFYLKRIKDRMSSRAGHSESPQLLIELLWLAYLMMIENDGKNEQQLLDYAEMDTWLMEYWFDDNGASLASRMIVQDVWPAGNEDNSIAMWLFWFLLRPGLILRNITRFPQTTTIMKLTALAASHYPVCCPSWTDFRPRSQATLPSSVITHFSQTYRLNPPTLAPAAILVFLTLALRVLVPRQANHAGVRSLQSPASLALSMRNSEDWDADWYRCINLGRPDRCQTLSEVYTLGCMEGFWEGVFTYTEFEAYSLLLSGGAPPVINNCLVAHHPQTWKLREYHLTEHQELTREMPRPLGSGDPLKAFFPAGTRLREFSDSVQIREPGNDVVDYHRASHVIPEGHKVADVILLGEGHSAWGQYNLYGRVRPLDGLIILSKEYVEGDRGRWLYRGYLVGNTNGHVSGRWRDTLSPGNLQGYEGCFVMSRRR